MIQKIAVIVQVDNSRISPFFRNAILYYLSLSNCLRRGFYPILAFSNLAPKELVKRIPNTIPIPKSISFFWNWRFNPPLPNQMFRTSNKQQTFSKLPKTVQRPAPYALSPRGSDAARYLSISCAILLLPDRTSQ